MVYPFPGDLQPGGRGRGARSGTVGPMDEDLPERLTRCAEALVVPTEEDGTPATLVALMPCEPVVGEVAVACWRDSDGGELVELVRLADGTRLDDPAALRESLTLLAMVETVEELAAFTALGELDAELAAWEPLPAEEVDPAALVRARDRAREALGALAALAPVEARMARTERLDELGAALRALDSAWAALEQAAEAWSDAVLAATQRSDDAVNVVQVLWRSLAAGRGGPLARPVSAALHEAREAGTLMASAVAATRPSP